MFVNASKSVPLQGWRAKLRYSGAFAGGRIDSLWNSDGTFRARLQVLLWFRHISRSGRRSRFVRLCIWIPDKESFLKIHHFFQKHGNTFPFPRNSESYPCAAAPKEGDRIPLKVDLKYMFLIHDFSEKSKIEKLPEARVNTGFRQFFLLDITPLAPKTVI